MGRLPPTAGKSQEEAAAAVGVAQGTIAKWEGISNVKDDNTYNPPDLTIKVAKAEHHAKLFLLTSGAQGPEEITKKIDTDKICNLFEVDKIADHPDVTVAQARISQIVHKSDTAKINNL